METFVNQLPYVGVVTLLLLCGFGLPLPEDITLLLAGYMCAIDRANIWLMIPLCLAAVMVGDATLFLLGRRYWDHVPKIPLVRRYLTERRLRRARVAFVGHSGKTLFTARFLPGLRGPIFFTAGAFKVPFWKMLTFDGLAALISVPVWVLLPYFLADHIETLKKASRNVQLLIVVAVVLVIAGCFVWWRLRRRKVNATKDD